MVLDMGDLVLEDAVISETRSPDATINGGPGIGLFRGGRLAARRIASIDNQQVGVVAFDEGSFADFTDLVVDGVVPWGPEGVARGIDVEEEAGLTCRRCAIRGLGEAVVAVGRADVTLEDLLVHAVEPGAMGNVGRGVSFRFTRHQGTSS